MKKYDVIALGELLIDFTDYGISEQTNPVFEANPGGAPCNVLALLKKYDRSCAFIGKIGEDLFGKMLTDILDEIGIDHKGLIVDPYYNTTLAFVKNFENGDREFSFYRHPGADMMLKASEVAYDLIRQAEIFHFGTLSMTDETVREATIQAIALAKEQGLLISFDPNLRPPLWKSMDEAKVQIAYGLGQCDVLKISDNEIEFMTDTSDFDEGVQILMDQYPNIRLLNLTAGADGSYSYYQGKKVFVPSYLLGGTVDTTGESQMLLHILSQQKRVRFVLCRIRMKSKKLLKVNSTHIFNLCITVFIQFMQSFFDVSKAGVYELSIKITVNDGNLMQFSHCK